VQEWATHNGIHLPNNIEPTQRTSFRLEEHQPKNILQVRGRALLRRRCACECAAWRLSAWLCQCRDCVRAASSSGVAAVCCGCRVGELLSACARASPAPQGHEEIVWAVEVHGRRLFSASADKTIRVWDIDSRRCEHVLEDHTRPVLSLTISGNRLYSGSYDFTIKVCVWGGGGAAGVLGDRQCACCSSRGHRCGRGVVAFARAQVWDINSLSRVKTLTGHTDAVRALSAADGRLFSGSYDGTVRVWDEATLSCLEVLKGHTGPVRTLVHAGGCMFSGSYDKSVRVWGVQTLECKAVLAGHTSAVRALVASPQYVFSGSDDTTIKVWDVDTLKCVKTLEGHEDNVRVLAVGDAAMFSGSWDKTIRVWDLRTLECVKVLEGHTEAVLALAGARGKGGAAAAAVRRQRGCTRAAAVVAQAAAGRAQWLPTARAPRVCALAPGCSNAPLLPVCLRRRARSGRGRAVPQQQGAGQRQLRHHRALLGPEHLPLRAQV
jgi:hypothetical protein